MSRYITPLTPDALRQVRNMLADSYPLATEFPATQLMLGTARKLLATLDAKTIVDVRDPRFVAAVDAVFAAPGEFGPAKGYYGPDTGHFIDMLAAELEVQDAQSAAATEAVDSSSPLVSEGEDKGAIP